MRRHASPDPPDEIVLDRPPPVDVVRTPYVRFVKPALDRLIALVLLLLLLPTMLTLGVLVWASVGRPVLFRQTRIGLGGKPFTVLKFRTMHADRRRPGRQWVGFERRVTHKHPRDPRVTRVGSFLRRLSLDEVPQLLNVLRGDMSLVGPRPELPSVVDLHYAAWHHRRHAVKPGITGLWQISERGNGMMHEHVDVDLDYVDSVSLVQDLRILARTVPAALGSRQGF